MLSTPLSEALARAVLDTLREGRRWREGVRPGAGEAERTERDRLLDGGGAQRGGAGLKQSEGPGEGRGAVAVTSTE